MEDPRKKQYMEAALSEHSGGFANVVILALFGMIGAVIILIWGYTDLSIKVFFTSMIVYIVTVVIYGVVKSAISDEVDKILAMKKPTPSGFQKRMAEYDEMKKWF